MSQPFTAGVAARDSRSVNIVVAESRTLRVVAVAKSAVLNPQTIAFPAAPKAQEVRSAIGQERGATIVSYPVQHQLQGVPVHVARIRITHPDQTEPIDAQQQELVAAVAQQHQLQPQSQLQQQQQRLRKLQQQFRQQRQQQRKQQQQ